MGWPGLVDRNAALSEIEGANSDVVNNKLAGGIKTGSTCKYKD
jgi:hypothetical protein